MTPIHSLGQHIYSWLSSWPDNLQPTKKKKNQTYRDPSPLPSVKFYLLYIKIMDRKQRNPQNPHFRSVQWIWFLCEEQSHMGL